MSSGVCWTHKEGVAETLMQAHFLGWRESVQRSNADCDVESVCNCGEQTVNIYNRDNLPILLGIARNEMNEMPCGF